MPRKCTHCKTKIPPETEHYEVDDKHYCAMCVDAKPYTAYAYYVFGEFIGTSEDESVRHIEPYEDDYET